MQRYVIDSHGPDSEAERAALRWLVDKARELDKHGAIVVPGVSSIANLSRVVGEQASAAAQRREIEFEGVSLCVYTPRTQPGMFDGPVLVLWADTPMVESAERLRPAAICATGWSDGGLDGWKRAWAPVDPRTGIADSAASPVSPAVRGLVISLTGPLGNDVLHPTDKRRAVTGFTALRMHGIPIDSELVRSLAIAAGWEPNAADRLASIALRIGSGRPVRGGDPLTASRARDLVDHFESFAAQ